MNEPTNYVLVDEPVRTLPLFRDMILAAVKYGSMAGAVSGVPIAFVSFASLPTYDISQPRFWESLILAIFGSVIGGSLFGAVVGAVAGIVIGLILSVVARLLFVPLTDRNQDYCTAVMRIVSMLCLQGAVLALGAWPTIDFFSRQPQWVYDGHGRARLVDHSGDIYTSLGGLIALMVVMFAAGLWAGGRVAERFRDLYWERNPGLMADTTQRLAKLTLFGRLSGWCFLRGLVAGLACSTACLGLFTLTFGPVEVFVSAFVKVALMGAAIGGLVGLIMGVVVAGETCTYFLPLVDEQSYVRIVTAQCMAVTLTASTFAVRAAADQLPPVMGFPIVLAGVTALSLLAAWGIGGRIVGWYRNYEPAVANEQTP
jgi:hypothetical protein